MGAGRLSFNQAGQGVGCCQVAPILYLGQNFPSPGNIPFNTAPLLIKFGQVDTCPQVIHPIGVLKITSCCGEILGDVKSLFINDTQSINGPDFTILRQSKQAAYLGQATIGQVVASYLPGIRYRLTRPSNVDRLVISTSDTTGASCSPVTVMNGTETVNVTVRPPTDSRCKYYTKQVRYMGTDWPSTTGMARSGSHSAIPTRSIQPPATTTGRLPDSMASSRSLLPP